MKRYFEAAVVYREEDEEKSAKRIYLVDAMTFIEAETVMSIHMTDWIDLPNFDIRSLKKVSYDDIIYRVGDEGYSWYEAKVKMKIGDEKEVGYNYLIADFSLREATGQLQKFLIDSQGTIRVTSMKAKELEDLVLKKQCCETCDMCELNYKVVSFDYQKSIEIDIDEVQERMDKLKEELGAESVSHKSYKIKVTKDSLKRVEGEILSKRVVKKWEEDFVDPDTNEVVGVERNEIVLNSGSEIDKAAIELIIESKTEFISIRR